MNSPWILFFLLFSAMFVRGHDPPGQLLLRAPNHCCWDPSRRPGVPTRPCDAAAARRQCRRPALLPLPVCMERVRSIHHTKAISRQSSLGQGPTPLRAWAKQSSHFPPWPAMEASTFCTPVPRRKTRYLHLSHWFVNFVIQSS